MFTYSKLKEALEKPSIAAALSALVTLIVVSLILLAFWNRPFVNCLAVLIVVPLPFAVFAFALIWLSNWITSKDDKSKKRLIEIEQMTDDGLKEWTRKCERISETFKKYPQIALEAQLESERHHFLRLMSYRASFSVAFIFITVVTSYILMNLLGISKVDTWISLLVLLTVIFVPLAISVAAFCRNDRNE